MSSYEDKKQARIDYYREKADKARQESESQYKKSHDMLGVIPLGQPMMPDHYSYKADKSYRNRAAKAMDNSIEAQKKAEYYEDKAKAAENNNAISSDDPEAVTKLKDKLDKLQNYQNRMKTVNAYYRKNGTMKGFEGISDEKASEIDEGVKNSYSWITAPYAPYQLSNNNAEINRLKKRIAALERRKEVGFAGWEFEGGKAVPNTDENRLQLFFDEIPSEEQRGVLKSNGFRWSRYNKAWQRQLNANAIYAASRISFLQPSDGSDIRNIQPKTKKEPERN